MISGSFLTHLLTYLQLSPLSLKAQKCPLPSVNSEWGPSYHPFVVSHMWMYNMPRWWKRLWKKHWSSHVLTRSDFTNSALWQFKYIDAWDMCWLVRQFSEEGSLHPGCQALLFFGTWAKVWSQPDFISEDCIKSLSQMQLYFDGNVY